jgi:serine/threonine protein kinase
MAELGSCPSRDELQQMVLGQLPDLKANRIQLHLERCPKCCSALDQCVTSDQFLEALQHRQGASEPTKTMYVPVECLRGALSTWSRGFDKTQGGKSGRPFSMSELSRQLSPPESADEIGRLGEFRVLRVLGVGGFALVFEGEDCRLKRHVALKLMHPAIAGRPGGAERFLLEAQSAAALKHEHVVTIYHVGMHGQTPFMALELLHGETLEDHLVRKGRLSVREIVRIGREIATGLTAAHVRGLLHRDIKPANIWLEQPETLVGQQPLSEQQGDSQSVAHAESSHPPIAEQPAGKVKILDFGCAKSWADEVAISDHGLLIGTPAYMAPEQFTGEAVDPRTDLFSLGCVLYRMAAGRRPFGGDNVFSVVRALALEDPMPLTRVDPRVPPALSDLVGRLLSKSREDRPATAQAVVDQLRLIGETVEREPVAANAAAGRSNKPSSRGARKKWIIGAGIGLAVVLLVAQALWGAQLIRVATNKGQVVIKVDDPTVGVTVAEDQIVIHDGEGRAEITLAAGPHQLDVTLKQPSGEARFRTDKFTLSRGGKQVIEVGEELKAAAATPSAVPLDRTAAEWVLSLKGSVTVREKQTGSQILIDEARLLPAGGFELTRVDLSRSAVTDDGLVHLRGLSRLIELDLNRTQISDAGLAPLGPLTQLESLDLSGTRTTDSGLTELGELQALRMLNLCFQPVTDAGLAIVCRIKGLEQLVLIRTRVTDAGLGPLKNLPHLERLYIGETALTDKGLAELGALKSLHVLGLNRTHVSNAGLARLLDLPQLDVLSLCATEVGDGGLGQLKRLKRLSNLNLGETKITAAGLKELQQLDNLRVLDLRGASRIGDESLTPLQNLRNVVDLDLSDTKVTSVGVAQLRKSLPQCRIVTSHPGQP